MRHARMALLVTLGLVIAWSATAGEKKDEKKAAPCPAAQRIDRLTQGMTLTDDQKAKFGDLCKEFGPKLTDAMKRMREVLTPEQRKAQAEAIKAAKEAGKTGKELGEAAAAAITLTDEQKAKQAEIKKEIGDLEKGLREKVMTVLTPEQQEQVKKKLESGKKRAAK